MVPFLRPVEAVDDVQHGTLAGAVRPDDGQDLSAADFKTNAVERTNAAERQADVLDLEQHVADPPRRRWSCVNCSCHALGRRRETVATAWTFKSARMKAVRPSSKVTFASTGTDERSEYSAAIKCGIAFGYRAAAHFACAGQLAIVGIEFLVQDQEAPDLRTGQRRVFRQVAIDRGDIAGNQIVDFVAAGEVGIAGVSDAAPLRPVADRIEIDIDEARGEITAVAERHGFFDIRERT